MNLGVMEIKENSTLSRTLEQDFHSDAVFLFNGISTFVGYLMPKLFS